MKAKERIIYDNYNIWDLYHEDAEDYLCRVSENFSENDVWEEVVAMDQDNWETEKERLEIFFQEKSEKWVLTGVVELWHGKYRSAFFFESFDEMMKKAGKDCDYFRFYDENGHLYLTCSHHEGTNCYEIKAVTPEGVRYFENWEYGNDKRTERQVYRQILKRYSRLPNFAHEVYGCSKREYAG
ncbi:MAG: hypothetical protein LUE86_13255 [Clostridiales bacterium]|nr:hypothetical protein [Clostridiales bacterium]